MPDRIDAALDGLTARDQEELARRLQLRMRACRTCGGDGADAYTIVGTGLRKGTRASILLCPACFEQHRLPEGRAAGDPGAGVVGSGHA